jgi:hypothetical protein
LREKRHIKPHQASSSAGEYYPQRLCNAQLAQSTDHTKIIISKYQFGLPLYRQEAMFKQYGIELSRKITAQWMMKCADILQILYDRLRQTLLKQAAIFADETTINVVSDKTPNPICGYTPQVQTRPKES